MMTRLSARQIHMMAHLDDGFPYEDSVGRELDFYIGHESRTIDSLVKRGLVEIRPGRGLQIWFRLTQKGRKLREEGKA